MKYMSARACMCLCVYLWMNEKYYVITLEKSLKGTKNMKIKSNSYTSHTSYY